MSQPLDINGCQIELGTRARILSLSDQWLNDLPVEEKNAVMSMVSEIFEFEEIDQYSNPWVRRYWPYEAEGKCHSHLVALEQHEMEEVKIKCPPYLSTPK